VVGSLQLDSWTDKATNEPRQRAKVVVRDLDILETKAEAEARRGNRRGPSFYTSDDDDDDNDDDYSPVSGGSGGFFS
jgi:single-stranded DNA-binding protein